VTGRIARELPERSTTLVRGFGRVLDRAVLVGGVAAVVVALLSSLALLTRLSLLLAPPIGAVVGTIVGLAVARLLIPTGLLRAYEAFSWLGRSETDRFMAQTGSLVPVKRADIERWLAENPPTPPMQLGRVELLAYVGRLDEARAELDGLEATRWEVAFERASLAQYIGWLTDGHPRIEEFRAAIVDLPLDEHYRLAADVTIAIAEARNRYLRADADWSRPLQAVRPSLGPAASSVVRRDTWRPMAILYLLVALTGAFMICLLAILP
jgi:hypothetical protein